MYIVESKNKTRKYRRNSFQLPARLAIWLFPGDLSKRGAYGDRAGNVGIPGLGKGVRNDVRSDQIRYTILDTHLEKKKDPGHEEDNVIH